MKLLVIADWHHVKDEEIELLKNYDFDACISCGDIRIAHLTRVKGIAGDRPCLGVAGNHDDWDTPEKAGFNNIHLQRATIGDETFAGLSGSSRYKNGRYFPMFEQEEALDAVKNALFDGITIFVSHDSIYQQYSQDLPHEGLMAVSHIIDGYKPQIHLYGHHHKPEEEMSEYKNGTKWLCTYRANIVDTKTQIVRHLF